jgi:hypothetical protein
MHADLHPDAVADLNPEGPESDIEDIDDATGPEQSLLNGNRTKALSEHVNRDYKMTPMGRLRAYWLGIVVCIGGFLCEHLIIDAVHLQVSEHNTDL